jgi:hypothetical protein
MMRFNYKKSILLFSSYLLLISCAAHNNPPVHNESFTPGLGEIMSLTSMRHAKLALAGQAQNWQLAEYELDELHEGFDDAVKFHPTHKNIKDVAKLITGTMNNSMKELEKAIKAKNVQQFNEKFDQLTAACNACHQMTEFGFNVVTRPTSNPFVNQDFSIH